MTINVYWFIINRKYSKILNFCNSIVSVYVPLKLKSSAAVVATRSAFSHKSAIIRCDLQRWLLRFDRATRLYVIIDIHPRSFETYVFLHSKAATTPRVEASRIFVGDHVVVVTRMGTARLSRDNCLIMRNNSAEDGCERGPVSSARGN